MTMHATSTFEQDEDGFWVVECECGWQGGAYPDPDLAADAYGDHRFDVATAEAAERARRSGR